MEFNPNALLDTSEVQVIVSGGMLVTWQEILLLIMLTVLVGENLVNTLDSTTSKG